MPEQGSKCNIPYLKVSLEAIFSKMNQAKKKSFHLSARELQDKCSAFMYVEIICFEHLQQGSHEKLNPRIFFARVPTASVLFFKLKFLIPTLCCMFCLPEPSNICRESDFVSYVSQNKLEKYKFLWFKKRDFYFKWEENISEFFQKIY